jgi:2-oxoglutarate ferredoxin oxidoreductase subunit gamma
MSIKEKVLFAGFGGQGILAAGKILADSLIDNGLNASWLPSYGPEMRGGTCNCKVVATDGEIESPVFTRPTSMIIMNQASLDFFSRNMYDTKLLVYNSSLVEVPQQLRDKHPATKFVGIDATNIALDLGNVRSANIVILGTYARYNNALNAEGLKKSVSKIFANKAGVMSMNLAAIDKGHSQSVE